MNIRDIYIILVVFEYINNANLSISPTNASR